MCSRRRRHGCGRAQHLRESGGALWQGKRVRRSERARDGQRSGQAAAAGQRHIAYAGVCVPRLGLLCREDPWRPCAALHQLYQKPSGAASVSVACSCCYPMLFSRFLKSSRTEIIA